MPSAATAEDAAAAPTQNGSAGVTSGTSSAQPPSEARSNGAAAAATGGPTQNGTAEPPTANGTAAGKPGDNGSAAAAENGTGRPAESGKAGADQGADQAGNGTGAAARDGISGGEAVGIAKAAKGANGSAVVAMQDAEVKHSAAEFDAEAAPLSSFMLNGQDYSKERSLRVSLESVTEVRQPFTARVFSHADRWSSMSFCVPPSPFTLKGQGCCKERSLPGDPARPGSVAAKQGGVVRFLLSTWSAHGHRTAKS